MASETDGKITRDPDYPADAAHLMAAFNRCAGDHPLSVVLEASAQMLICVIVNTAKAHSATDEQFANYVAHVLRGVANGTADNWAREPQSGDVPVKQN